MVNPMLFNSWQFICLFLPVVFVVYYLLTQFDSTTYARVWLVVASFFFYGYWDQRYIPLIVVSIAFNFCLGRLILKASRKDRSVAKLMLFISISANLVVLAYYKYVDFIIQNLNSISGFQFPLLHISLPLAISFFTFTQIIYLVDCYRGETEHYNLLNYSLFVTFFPHLIAGPLVQHSHIMPQFEGAAARRPDFDNIFKGLFLFGVGLFKKVAIADSFAPFADRGFDSAQPLQFYEAWATSLSYTFQLYFDFSGYCDMAIGVSLLFNIVLPINFNSPYKATNIQQFWRRWHITLSNFLRDFLYIPLGGSRLGNARTYLNLLATFALGGLWHGATWMYVTWGALHGVALVVHRAWSRLGIPMPRVMAWLLTFLFINASWVFFRAKTFPDTFRILGGMVDFKSAVSTDVAGAKTSYLAWAGTLSDTMAKFLPSSLIGQLPVVVLLVVAGATIAQRNSAELVEELSAQKWSVYGGVLFALGMYLAVAQTSTVFLYFTF